MIERIHPAHVAPPGGHYSPATAFGDLVFVAGQLPVASDGSHDPHASFEAQARQALDNLLSVLSGTNSGPGEVLRVTAYIVGTENWPLFNSIYAELFGDARPARTIVPVPALHYGYLVEVDAIAVRGGSDGVAEMFPAR